MPEELFPNVVGSPAIYVTNRDRLIISAYNSHAAFDIEVRTRTLTPDGQITPGEYILTPTTDRQFSVITPTLPSGWLLSIVATPAIATLRQGECYVTLGLQRNVPTSYDIFEVLAQGYLTTNNFVSWPKADSRINTEGPGRLFIHTQADPAVGVEISYTVPVNARQRILAFRFQFATSAVVANRYPTLVIRPDGTTSINNLRTVTAQPASNTNTFVFQPEFPVFENVQGVYNKWMPDIVLPQGAILFTTTANLDGGDQYSEVRLYIEEWIED